MAITTERIKTLEDLLERIGNVPPSRIRARPAVGTATEADVIEAERKSNRLCELVEGVLVEKAMGYRESLLALALAGIIRAFVVPRNLGLVSGADGMMRLNPGLIRIPDVAFSSWDRFPDGKVPEEPIPTLAPDLAIEVLSVSNTRAEMELKRREYFEAGVRLVWYVDPRQRTVRVIRPDRDDEVLDESATLDGEDVLPGFAVPLRALFTELDQMRG